MEVRRCGVNYIHDLDMSKFQTVQLREERALGDSPRASKPGQIAPSSHHFVYFNISLPGVELGRSSYFNTTLVIPDRAQHCFFTSVKQTSCMVLSFLGAHHQDTPVIPLIPLASHNFPNGHPVHPSALHFIPLNKILLLVGWRPSLLGSFCY